MKTIAHNAFPFVAIGALLCEARATDRFFDDISVQSPSGRYRVEAKSPDNANKSGNKAFQASFVYTCQDTVSKQVLWTRKQGMGKPRPPGKGSEYSLPEEASPLEIFVSDPGWTVIRTGWDELIAIDSTGQDRGRIDLLSEGFTKSERAKYVQNTTAGPMWSGYSLWYFLEVGRQHLFVVRPWWGHRLILNLETGKLIDADPKISNRAVASERDYVMTELAEAVKTRGTWENKDCCEALGPTRAAYLAGRLSVAEAIPFLEQLQDTASSGSSTMGGLGERFHGEVNPLNYSTFTLRQVIHVSLRRLGKNPKPLPLNEFEVQYEDYKKNRPYHPKVITVPRLANVGKVHKGMKAEEVLDLIGAPDFVNQGTWEYDMDSGRPFTLILKWNVRFVADIQKKTPALWKEGFIRDAELVR